MPYQKKGDWSWPSFLREIDSIERSWITRLPPPGPGMVGWIPQPIGQFTSMLLDAMTASRVARPVFLDVGSGPGTKVLLASALFGIRAYGVELSPDLAHAAQARGADTLIADCMEYADYGMADVLLLNRPVQDRQAECEHRVRDLMHRGAVLIFVNGLADPGEDWGWEMISQEYGTPVTGVWRKLLSQPPVTGRAEPGLPGRAKTGRTMPRLPSHACPAAPSRAVPCHACRAKPGRSTPSHACRACRTLPSRSLPNRACRATPDQAEASPAMPAGPGLALPCLSAPAEPRRAVPCRTLPRPSASIPFGRMPLPRDETRVNLRLPHGVTAGRKLQLCARPASASCAGISTRASPTMRQKRSTWPARTTWLATRKAGCTRCPRPVLESPTGFEPATGPL